MMGLSEADIAAIAEHLAGAAGGTGVWPQNVPAVSAFMAVASQWRSTLVPTPQGMTLYWIGLDYTAARTALDALAIGVTPHLWADLVEIEDAARAALNGTS